MNTTQETGKTPVTRSHERKDCHPTMNMVPAHVCRDMETALRQSVTALAHCLERLEHHTFIIIETRDMLAMESARNAIRESAQALTIKL